MNIQEQSKQYMNNLQNRRRDPATGNTVAAYQSYLRNHILPAIGQVELADVKNGILKQFVVKLSEKKLAPASIAGVVNVVKGIMKSATNDEGEYLFNNTWNNIFIDAPPVVARDQEGPILSREALEVALNRATGQFRTLCVLLGASGLRISEALAVKRGVDSWDPDNAVIKVKSQIYKGLEQDPKTDAGFREVDLAPELNQYLLNVVHKKNGEYLFATKGGRPLSLPTVYGQAKKAGIPGFHSFRRFKITHLRMCMIPEDIIKFWIGHADKDITDRYSKMAENVGARKRYAASTGLGFDLPKD